ncbi:GNAT family N-acetyltransferase [Chloroflexota bacterium]
MNELEIRDAIKEDKDEILKFCRDTWDWGDYIEYTWDDWLNDPEGRLIVGILDGVPVAVVHIGLMPTGEGWIEGMRIAPEHRDKQIGTALSNYCVDEMAKADIRVARYMTASSNKPVQRISEKHGFKRFGSCYVLWAELKKGQPGITKLQPDCIDELWSFVEKSEVYKASAGLYSVGWIYQELNKDRLKYHLEHGEVYFLAGGEPLGAFAIVATSWLHKGPVIGYLDGKSVKSLGALVSEARLLDMDAEVTVDRRIDANFPELDWMKKLYLEAGYQPYYNEPFLLYDLWL